MPTPAEPAHVTDLLPDLVSHHLSVAEARRVRAHLASCAACQAELRVWERIGAAERFAVAEARAPTSALLDRVWAEIDGVAAAEQRTPAFLETLRHAVCVLAAQRRVLRRSVWIASALGIAFAVISAATLELQTDQSSVLVFALPLIAATGSAFLYGPEVDPGLEIAITAPTPPRMVMLSRFALLFGFDLACALAGTLALALVRGEGFWPLTALWLGPMALLSTLSLVLSLVVSPLIGAAGALALWGARALRLSSGIELQIVPGNYWGTSPQVLAIAAALLLAAVLYAPRVQTLPLADV
jgi:hypothetical protein